jgi:hypothetical protein
MPKGGLKMRIFAHRPTRAHLGLRNQKTARKPFRKFVFALLSAVLLATGANFVQAPVAMAAVQETSMDRYYDTGSFSWAHNQGLEDFDQEAFTITNNSTVQFWINIPASLSRSFLSLAGRENSWVFSQLDNGNFGWAYWGPNGAWAWIDSGVQMRHSQWMHVAVRNSGRTTTLFFDGVAVSSGDTWFNASDKNFTGAPTDSNAPFAIGGRTALRDNNFLYNHSRNAGFWIDEFKVYRSDRSANLLSDMHNRADVNDSALSVYYDFNEIGATIKNQKSMASNTSDIRINNFEGNAVNRKDVKTVTRPATRQGKTVVTFPRSYITKENGWVVPTGLGQVEVLQVAGGGAGGSRHAGGGAAGAYNYRPAVNVVPGQTLKVQVGQGGIATRWFTQNSVGGNGQNTFFGTNQAVGGSGSSSAGAPAGQNFAGGLGSIGNTNFNYTGGGGPGAGSAGGNSSPSGSTTARANAGSGGRGISSTITGASVCYAAGGGGGVHWDGGNVGAGGSCPETNTTVGGAGGKGRVIPNTSMNAVANTGSGGGGGGWDERQSSVQSGLAGDGGSGVIVITYSNNVPLALNNGCDTYQYETGNFTIEEFRDTGTCNWVVPAGVTALDVLVVGGGGGGGAHVGAGGGGGGTFERGNLAVTPGATVPIEVGAGGAGAVWNPRAWGSNGGKSKFGTFEVLGGGRGASWNWSNANGTGNAGNSLLAQVANGGGGTQPSGPGPGFRPNVSGYSSGFSGGSAPNGGSEPHVTGGGAGAGGAGQNDRGRFIAGNGGPGVATGIRGYTEYFAGGGGGGSHGWWNYSTGQNFSPGVAGVGGIGGGGAGSTLWNHWAWSRASDGQPNTGGGGGGAGGHGNTNSIGGNGGSGTVIVKYLSTNAAVMLTIDQEAVGGQESSTLIQVPVIALRDAGGDIATSDNSTMVTVSGTGVGGTTQVRAVNGIATFTGLTISQSTTLTFSAPNLRGVQQVFVQALIPTQIEISTAQSVNGVFRGNVWVAGSSATTTLNVTDLLNVLNSGQDVRLTTTTGDININNDVITNATGAGALSFDAGWNVNNRATVRSQTLGKGISVRAKALVTVAADKAFVTNKAPITIWADSDNNNFGYVYMETGSSLNSVNATALPTNRATTLAVTDGGKIVIGGGAPDSADPTIPGGFAQSSTSAVAGVDMRRNSQIYSGGGDISIRGRALTGTGAWRAGITMWTNVRLNSGTGRIHLEGDAVGNTGSWNSGIEMNLADSCASTANGFSITSASNDSVNPAITMIGRAGSSAASNGITNHCSSSSNTDVTIQALGTAGISMVGSTQNTSEYGIDLNGVNVLSRSGKILLDGGLNGVATGSNVGVSAGVTTFGSCVLVCGTQDFGFDAAAVSSSDVEIYGDRIVLTANNALNRINTTGNVRILPSNQSTRRWTADVDFYATLPTPVASFTAGYDLGAGTTSQRFRNRNAITSNGAIKMFASIVDVFGNLKTNSLGAKILLKSSVYVYTDGISVTTNKGPIILWSDSDQATVPGGEVAIGANSVLNTANGAAIPTTTANVAAAIDGGEIVMAGGPASQTDAEMPAGFSLSNGNFPPMRLEAGSRVYSGGGNISIKAQNRANISDHWIGAVRIHQNTIINSGAGEVYIEGDSTAQTSSNSFSHGSGVLLSFGGTTKSMITSAGGSTTESAIRIVGRGGVNENGIDSYYAGTRGSVVIESLGTGTIDLIGSTTHADWYGINLGGSSILSRAGAITLNGGTNGVRLNNWNNVTAFGNMGACPASSTPTNCGGTDSGTTTAADISIQGGRYDGATDAARQIVVTTGNFRVTPVLPTDQFVRPVVHYATISGPAKDIQFGNDLGEITYNQPVSVFGTYSASGNIQTFGGATEVNGTFTAGSGFQMVGAALTAAGTVTAANGMQLIGNSVVADANMTVTGQGFDMLFRAKGDITTTTVKTFTTNQGDITFWADSDAATSLGGKVTIENQNVLKTKNVATASIPATNAALMADSGGGRITIGGGAASSSDSSIPGGAAYAAGGEGIFIGHTSTLYSGGGEISLRGRSNGASTWHSGISIVDAVSLRSGTGQIKLDGESAGSGTYAAGIQMNRGNGSPVTFYSASDVHPAISLNGRSGTGASGIEFVYGDGRHDIQLQALGTGGLRLTGDTTSTTHFGIRLDSIAMLSKTGDIELNGGARGISQSDLWNNVGGITFGDCSATAADDIDSLDCNRSLFYSNAARSTADVKITTGQWDGHSTPNVTRMNTTGDVSIVPFAGER